MTEQKVENYLNCNKERLFPNNEVTEAELKQALLAAPDTFEMYLNSMPLRNPSVYKLIAFALGSFGVDRFYLQDIQKGVLKFMTAGGFLIWWLKDVITAKKRCKAYNCKQLIAATKNPAVVAEMKNMDSKIAGTMTTAKKMAPEIKKLGKSFKDLQDTFEP